MKDTVESDQETIKTTSLLRKLGMKGKNFFIAGNDAITLGAIFAGCRFFSGYPITPSSEVLTMMARNLPKFNDIFYQTEDEIAAIGMAISASIGGTKSMTATSGPGFSLMQEELSLAIINEVPIVVVNVMRVGPSTGQPTKPASADIDCMINGRHGDDGDKIIILSPNSVQECFDLTIQAFNLSEKYRIPVLLAVDGYISHLSENLVIPDEIITLKRSLDKDESPFGIAGKITNFIPVGQGMGVAFGGLVHDQWGNRKSFDPEICKGLLLHHRLKNALIPTSTEEYGVDEKCEYLIISYGLASRASKDVVHQLRTKQMNIGLLSLKTLWPINKLSLEKFSSIKKIIVVENNAGQLVKLLYKHIPKEKLVRFNKYWGEPIGTQELLDFCKKVMTAKKPIVRNEITKALIEKEDLMSDGTNVIGIRKRFPFCMGCGHKKFIDLLLPILEESGLNKSNTILVCGIGCAGIIATTLNGDVIKTSHGRALNAARAIQLTHPNHTVVVISGDGDLVNIGGNHLIHTARDGKRFPILCICLDNKTYGMTGGQPSCTTPPSATTSIPFSQNEFDLKHLLYDGCEIDFFARTMITKSKQVKSYLKKAIKHTATRKSFAFVHILGLCISHFGKKNPAFLGDKKLEKTFKVWERSVKK